MGNPTLVGVTVAVALVAAGLAAVLYQLVRQQGRLLLRLDHVERRLGLDPRRSLALDADPAGDPASSGLAVGTEMPAFELPDLEGRSVTLEQLRGRRALLVHWSARCGFCAQIASELAALAPQLDRSGVRLLLIGHGPAADEEELAREHGLEGSLLIAGQGSTDLEAFAGLGTPSAYLLDAEGRVAEPLAIGAIQVPALARLAAGVSEEEGPRKTRLPGERPLAESRIERNGLSAGTPAPVFELPEVRGGTVSLSEHRGRKVLLIFSDPHCGPCGKLAPHLIRLHEEHRNNGLDLLLVGRGEIEENRRYATEQGFEFPVVVQRRWELSKQYGIFATPVGFLIGEDGVIARNVARGYDEILSLVKGAEQ
jgi:peroxiredoxin